MASSERLVQIFTEARLPVLRLNKFFGKIIIQFLLRATSDLR